MSNTDRGRLVRRALALLGTAALALGGAVATSTAASADTLPGNINPDTPRSLTVHKFKEMGSTTQLNPDGSSNTGAYTPLNGVNFTVQRVAGIDLTTTGGWDVVPTLAYSGTGTTVTGTGGPYNLVDPVTNPTVSGAVTFPGLPIGVYLVTEGTDTGNNQITSKAAPFFVTLPLPDSNEWLYAVHVYPKNSVGSISKTVDSSTAVKLGDTVTWTVTAAIPQLAAGATLSTFNVSDVFDSRLGTPTVTSVMIDGVADPGYSTAGSAGQTVIVTPTLATVNAKQGKNVVITYTSTVQSLGADGVIDNQAIVHLPGQVSIPSNEPFVKFGAVLIEKYAAGMEGVDTSHPLNGASFALYKTNAEAVAALAGTVGTPVWTGTTATDGTVLIPGLYVGNNIDGANTRNYYLVETQAPAGYDRYSSVITVEVTPSSTEGAEIVQVANRQKPPVELPLTGSTGTALFLIGGAALILIAGGGALVASRRRHGSATE